ncbi:MULTISPECIES: flagellar basal body rod protein FlgB [Aneurinibacillus]|uniref:Flagellar basal body rod protein FlgB n=1 Tax=Aneurinibacillus thermoaerophilus TaxID=143495 RepID=A0A1G7WE60_ANETH|nr:MULTISPECIES: flagellar basal body rod protein FlgB [Aneurinibacillus]AMA72663.1 hypothetical protein ACH33_07230 [Aneurinibacillus sp. XH2]MED0674620.1 flagellar basal body rod protein FlgB [Aneurinibacillus thermoaerophilus]MED0677989.1 flagellar basal body rod protein FlgB [Aneurinibacillus thermoaerophilus]MED0736948.1 flagellar basal body rod protein FlgB [Aneurinibacillus thermoaerophilus]MED0756789.1 flagellar basal body rod protein FlgB [Aneurinibacillus thermoaerophilus]
MLMTQTLTILEKALDAATMRQKAISNNIANVDTPYYKSQSVTFESELQRALSRTETTFSAYRTDKKHIAFGTSSLMDVRPRLQIDSSIGPMQNTANNVDLDFEMTNLAKNQLWYNALVQQTAGQFTKLRAVIGGKA